MKEVSCTQEGLVGNYCALCDYLEPGSYVVTPTLQHQYVEKIDNDSTCIATGNKHKECSVCHSIKTGSYEVIPMKDHLDSDGNHICDNSYCQTILDFDLNGQTLNSSKDLLTIDNNGFDVFTTSQGKVSYQYDQKDYQVSLSLTAKKDMRIAFKLGSTGDDYSEYFTISLKVGNTTLDVSNPNVSRTIKANQKVVITITKKQNVEIPQEFDFEFYLENFVISA